MLFKKKDKGAFLKNKILISTSSTDGDVFGRSIVYVCEHSHSGAMGIVVNQKIREVEFHDLIEQLNLSGKAERIEVNPDIYFGGPVDSGRGFVLHSTDFIGNDTKVIDGEVAITGTVDILKKIARGNGPSKMLFALGYAGWGPGQLEQEVCDNSWLVVDADEELLFDSDIASKWDKAMLKLGVDPMVLSSDVGHA